MGFIITIIFWILIMNGMTINHIVSIDHGSYQKLGKKLSKQDIHPMHPKVLDAVLGEEMTKTIWSVAWLFRGAHGGLPDHGP